MFFQADCEDTKLPDSSIDLIICSGMLHHLDLSYVFPELRRVLKADGKILAIEALDYNPAIKLYRLITPDMRTEWEKAHILSFSDLEFAKRYFNVKNVKYEIDMKKIMSPGGTTVGLANGMVLADNKKIYSAESLKVGLFK